MTRETPNHRGWSSMTPFRKELRVKATNAENLLWQYLRAKQLKGFKFRRQHGIGHLIVDFYCDAGKLIIELDGSIHDELTQKLYDCSRQEFIEDLGYQVIRFRNEEIFENLEFVLACILAKLPSSYGGVGGGE